MSKFSAVFFNLRSGSIFVLLWKLHSVRENVWEPLKLGLISGYSFLGPAACFFGSGNNIRTRTRRLVSSILTWSSESFLSFLVLEIFFFQNKNKRCFQLPKPFTSFCSLKEGSIMEFCSAPLHASGISAHALTTLRAIKRLKEKTKDFSFTLTRASQHI